MTSHLGLRAAVAGVHSPQEQLGTMPAVFVFVFVVRQQHVEYLHCNTWTQCRGRLYDTACRTPPTCEHPSLEAGTHRPAGRGAMTMRLFRTDA